MKVRSNGSPLASVGSASIAGPTRTSTAAERPAFAMFARATSACLGSNSSVIPPLYRGPLRPIGGPDCPEVLADVMRRGHSRAHDETHTRRGLRARHVRGGSAKPPAAVEGQEPEILPGRHQTRGPDPAHA